MSVNHTPTTRLKNMWSLPASFGAAMVPGWACTSLFVLHVMAKRYAIFPKARQNNDTLVNIVNAYFFVYKEVSLLFSTISTTSNIDV